MCTKAVSDFRLAGHFSSSREKKNTRRPLHRFRSVKQIPISAGCARLTLNLARDHSHPKMSTETALSVRFPLNFFCGLWSAKYFPPRVNFLWPRLPLGTSFRLTVVVSGQ